MVRFFLKCFEDVRERLCTHGDDGLVRGVLEYLSNIRQVNRVVLPLIRQLLELFF
jgi:hypothetical protein